ncbi:MAG TPA: amidohydrolase, partial [Bacillota bacterium]|nr:amidohydrolase [Bacillota bacterium]
MLPHAKQPVASPALSRRQFLTTSTLFALAAATPGCKVLETHGGAEPIIDIHQHVGYSGRPAEVLLAHQRAMGVTKTILLPAGRPVDCAATHNGVSNGLQAQCYGNQACYRLAKTYPKAYCFGANEVPGFPETTCEIENYLKRGAVVLAEQKFGVECDSPEMQRLYQVAAEYHVPILMHWQHGMYNYGFERFYKM